jgi:hypothetical protein
MHKPWLDASEHRICVRLAELELAKRTVGRLADQKMLAGSVYIAEAALERVGIEESTAARRLECNRCHALRYLGDISSRRARLGLLLGGWHFPGRA